MPTVVIRHKVADFTTWINGHQERVDLFTPAISSFKTFQDTNDPNSIIMVCEVEDMEAMGALVNDPANDAIKERHTVLDPITVSMQVDA